jgi:hypothetical protein
LHILILTHIYAYTGRSRGAKNRIQAEQVQWVFRGPQASNYEDTDIVVIKESPSTYHQLSLAFL